jgi:hypothetical protein
LQQPPQQQQQLPLITSRQSIQPHFSLSLHSHFPSFFFFHFFSLLSLPDLLLRHVCIRIIKNCSAFSFVVRRNRGPRKERREDKKNKRKKKKKNRTDSTHMLSPIKCQNDERQKIEHKLDEL